MLKRHYPFLRIVPSLSVHGLLPLSDRQAKGGPKFAEEVLLKNAPSKRNFSMVDIDGKKMPLSKDMASRIYENIGTTRQMHVQVGRDALGRFVNQGMTVLPW